MKTADIEREFAEKRALLAQQTSDGFGSKLAEAVYLSFLAEDDAARGRGGSLLHDLDEHGQVSDLREAYSEGRLDAGSRFARKELRGMGSTRLPWQRWAQNLPQVIRRALEGLLKAFQAMEQRDAGRVVGTPPASPHADHGTSVASLRGLLDSWKAERKPTAKTGSEWTW